MSEERELPSLRIIIEQVESERATMNMHRESLDTKAGIILGFAGVLVGLGATAQSVISQSVLSEVGLGLTIGAAALAALAFLPRDYPVLSARRLRDKYLAVAEAETCLRLLDTQVEMTKLATASVNRKGTMVRLAVVFLASATALIVIGTLTVGG